MVPLDLVASGRGILSGMTAPNQDAKWAAELSDRAWDNHDEHPLNRQDSAGPCRCLLRGEASGRWRTFQCAVLFLLGVTVCHRLLKAAVTSEVARTLAS